jgi:nitroimidazol reductase NimA-like FMN-containing flavoprotein (pyridoxamine 5'-phosphate oxidase superfamily)
VSDKTQIRRLPERAVEDRAGIHAILDDGFLCHAAYLRDGRPVVIPTLYARDGDRLLLHGSNSSGLVRAVRGDLPISIGVTHIDGIVVARSGFHSSANYRSVVVHGMGRLLVRADHERALDLIVDWLIPGRVTDIRRPTPSELRQTSVIALDLDEVSAKVRIGDPKDDPDDLESDAWAGVVPISQVFGEPIPAGDLKPGIGVPDYLTRMRGY